MMRWGVGQCIRDFHWYFSSSVSLFFLDIHLSNDVTGNGFHLTLCISSFMVVIDADINHNLFHECVAFEGIKGKMGFQVYFIFYYIFFSYKRKMKRGSWRLLPRWSPSCSPQGLLKEQPTIERRQTEKIFYTTVTNKNKTAEFKSLQFITNALQFTTTTLYFTTTASYVITTIQDTKNRTRLFSRSKNCCKELQKCDFTVDCL